MNFEKSTFGVGQIIIVSASVTDPEGDQITLSWSSGSTNYGKGKELELTLSSIGDKTVTVTATDEVGNKSELSQTITVTECDFGFGMWGDDLKIIQRSETGTYKGNNLSIYHYLGSGWDRYYTMTNNKLTFGQKSYEYTPKSGATPKSQAWLLHESWMSDLAQSFGEPTGQNILRGQITGNNETDGQAMLNGQLIVETTFSNARLNVTYTFSRKDNYSSTIIYEIKYSQKNKVLDNNKIAINY